MHALTSGYNIVSIIWPDGVVFIVWPEDVVSML